MKLKYASPGIPALLFRPLWAAASFKKWIGNSRFGALAKIFSATPTLQEIDVFNSIVQEIYVSAFYDKQLGFRTYLLEQQQMLWTLNNKIDNLSNKANLLPKN